MGYHRPLQLLKPTVAALLIAAGPSCTCSPTTEALEGLPCARQSDCVAGWVCDLGDLECVTTSDCDDQDGDGYCAASDCDNDDDACTNDCADNDNDTVRVCDGDCDDDNADCAIDCTDADADGACADVDSNDNNANCAVDPTDGDADGYCLGVDCDDAAFDCTTECTDEDGDGVALCAGDCDDDNANCTTTCEDGDGDGYCFGHDCDDGRAFCTDNCTNVDGDEHCAPFDCDDEVAGCATDCVDSDTDGVWACEGDCDDTNPNCRLACADLDRDGFCADFDCDDTLGPCTIDCDTDGDNDGDADCVEVACDTNPSDIADDCVVVDGVTILPGDITADLPGAVEYANNNTGVTEKLLILESTVVTSQIDIGVDDCLEMRSAAGVVLSTDFDNDQMFLVIDDGCLFEGLVIEGGDHTITLLGDGTEVRDCELRRWDDHSAIRVTGDNNRIVNNVIHDGLAGNCDGCAGIYINQGPSSTRVIGNLIVDNASDGIQMRDDSRGTFIDHNTIANNTGDGIEVSSNASVNVCMRNNIFAVNGGFALHVRNEPITWATTDCTEPLVQDPDPHWGNNIIGNLGGECTGDRCTTCSCLPTGAFWEYQNTPPGFVDQVDYCLDPVAPSLLIDVGADLDPGATDPAYDRNAGAPGNFNGASVDIGARESGAGACSP